jgi:acetyltransferase-like isoleucine patch superfamily enzyme
MNKRLRAVARLVKSVVLLPFRVPAILRDKRKRRSCVVMSGAVLHPSCRVANNQDRSCIVVGENSQILAMLETMGHGGRIEIGSDCFVGENTRIWSASAIKIGDRVLISHDVNIHDGNAHSLSAVSRARHFKDIFSTGHPRVLIDVPTAPIIIDDDAWIGFGATIFKGVKIGKGAVVGACSLITKDVPPYTIMVGSPARVVGRSSP